MKIQDAEQMALSLMKFHGVQDFKFELMAKRKKFRRIGQCNWRKKIISIQPHFIECNAPIIVKRTILHEIAHALVGARNGHNRVWKEMDIKLGDDGKRTYGKEVKKKKRKNI